MKKIKKKLALRTETIRCLDSAALSHAFGGVAGPTAPTGSPTGPITINTKTGMCAPPYPTWGGCRPPTDDPTIRRSCNPSPSSGAPMKKTTTRKLSFATSTIRILTLPEASQVQGGRASPTISGLESCIPYPCAPPPWTITLPSPDTF